MTLELRICGTLSGCGFSLARATKQRPSNALDWGVNAKLVLFDIDGTLIASHGAGQRALAAALKQIFGDSVAMPDIDTSGKLDPQIYRELAACLPDVAMLEQELAFRQAYLEALRDEAASFELLPGVASCIAALRQYPHITLGLLTGNLSAAAKLKLQAVQLVWEWFAVTAFGEEAPSRADLVQLAMERYAAQQRPKVQAQDVVIVGDTPRDVACAHSHHCVAFAVATGRWDSTSLQAARADVVVENLLDSSPLWQVLGL